MSKNKNGLSTKYLKTGGYSIIVSVIAVAIVIFVNLLVNTLPADITKIDLSDTQMFTLGEETQNLVKEIDESVTVYFVVQPGEEDSNIAEILERYVELNDKIKVERVDPGLNPGFFVDEKEGLSENSLYIESEKRGKAIGFYDIYYPGFTDETIESYYYYYGTYPEASFNAENCITSVLDYVTTDVLPVVYNLSGHGEVALTTSYTTYLKEDNIELKTLNLATEENIPDDCSCILISSPKEDITVEEKDKILSYLKNGGRLMFVSYFEKIAEKPNLKALMADYGLEVVDGYVCEGSGNSYVSGLPMCILPSMAEHEITNPLNGYYLIMTNSHGIEVSDDKRDTVNVTPLLTTTDKAFSKLKYDKESNELPKKEEGDIDGPFSLAVAATETNSEGKQTQIVWVGTEAILYENGGVGYLSSANGAFFMNSLGWMCEKESAISIPAKSLEEPTLTIPEGTSTLLIAVFVVIIPLAVIVTGVVVWLRRRAK